MAEYIEREALLHSESWAELALCADVARARIIINAQPSADVVEVVHGEWIKTNKGQKCSNCKCLSSFWDDNLKSVYCPWCGAKMDRERRSENES